MANETKYANEYERIIDQKLNDYFATSANAQRFHPVAEQIKIRNACRKHARENNDPNRTTDFLSGLLCGTRIAKGLRG